MLATGAAGWFGHHLARALLEAGWRVRVLDVAPEPRWAAELGVEYHRGDVCDPEKVQLALDGMSAVVHSAFAPPEVPATQLWRVNVEGTRTLMRVALEQATTRVVMVSSTIVTRDLRPHPLVADTPATRLWAYRQTRIEAEAEAARAADAGLPVVVVRPKTLLGPGGVGPFALLFDLVRAGRSVPVLGDGQNRYQLLDVRDLAAGITLLVGPAGGGGCFPLGAVRFGTVAEDLRALVDHAGSGATLCHLPASLSRAGLRALPLAGLAPLSEWHHCSAEGRDSVVDTSRALAELGWQPRRSNTEALLGAFDWYANQAGSAAATSNHPVPTVHRALGRLAAAWPTGRVRQAPRPPPPADRAPP